MIKGIFFPSILAISLTVSGAVIAQDIPGQSDEAYLEARKAWLEGRDLEALQALKSLSSDGNTAAQILLARIGEMPHSFAHVTRDMDRKARIALTRQEKGLSGTSWLEAADHPLAAILLDAKASFGDGAVAEASRQIDTLLGQGEVRAATEVVFKLNDGLFVKETHDVLALYLDQLRPEAAVIAAEVSSQIAFVGGDDGLGVMPTAAQKLQTGRTPIWPHVDSPEMRATLAALAPEVDEWAPLVSLCQDLCANEVESCLVAGAAQAAISGPFPFATPLESLISDEDYRNSARITGDVLRRVGSISLPTTNPLTASQCLAEAVAAAQG